MREVDPLGRVPRQQVHEQELTIGGKSKAAFQGEDRGSKLDAAQKLDVVVAAAGQRVWREFHTWSLPADLPTQVLEQRSS